MVLISWFGHSCVGFQTQRSLYLCDPISDLGLCCEIRELTQQPKAIFISHEHRDHFSPETISRVGSEGTFLFAPSSVTGPAKSDERFDRLSVRGVEPGDAIELGDVACEVFEASEGVAYVLTFKEDDIVAFFMGDSVLLEPMKDIEADLTFFPVWALRRTENAPALSEFLNLSISIPVHYHHDRSAKSNFFVHPGEFARLTEPIETIKVLKRAQYYNVRVSDGKVLIDRIETAAE